MWALFRQLGLFGNLASFRNNYDPHQSVSALLLKVENSKYFSVVKNDRLALYDSLYKVKVRFINCSPKV